MTVVSARCAVGLPAPIGCSAVGAALALLLGLVYDAGLGHAPWGAGAWPWAVPLWTWIGVALLLRLATQGRRGDDGGADVFQWHGRPARGLVGICAWNARFCPISGSDVCPQVVVARRIAIHVSDSGLTLDPSTLCTVGDPVDVGLASEPAVPGRERRAGGDRVRVAVRGR